MAHHYESEDSEDDLGWRDDSFETAANSAPRFEPDQDSRVEPPLVEDAPDRQPDDCWMLPSNSTPLEVLGPNCMRLEDIRKATEAYMIFNRGKHQVDIWGDRACIDEAKKYLDGIGNRINEQNHPMRRTKKWGKPERELTEKEKRRDEKRQQRRNEERRYQGLPAAPLPYNSCFCMPDYTIPIPKIMGDKEAYMNQIRASCKTFIWYEKNLNAFQIAGQDEDLVDQAAYRVRNLYTKLRRAVDSTMPRRSDLRLLYQPTRNIGARYVKLPKDFIQCDLYAMDQNLQKYRIMEPLAGGRPSASLAQYNMLSGAVENMDINSKSPHQHAQDQQSISLIDFSENNDDDATARRNQNLGTCEIAESLRDLNKRNAKKMEKALDEGLESLRLLDWEINMEVAFGQIYLLNYQNLGDFYTYSSEELAHTYFPHPKFASKLAPCIGTTYNHIKGLLEYLSTSGEEYTDSPRTSYVIEAQQYPNLPEKPTPENGRPYRGGPSRAEQAAPAAGAVESWKSVLTVNTFTKEGHAGLWNCVIDNMNLVTINCTNLEGDYSWETRLNYARRLPGDYNTPQGQFVNHLRRSRDHRLVMSVTPSYQPHLIKQRTEWVYAWEQYIIKVQKEEMWDVSNMDDASIATNVLNNGNDNRNSRNYQDQRNTASIGTHLPTDLSSFTPHSVKYYVTMAREDWQYRFTENIDLDIGMAPKWTTRDFLAGAEENTTTLQRDAKLFADLLAKVLPVYYEHRQTSLV